MFNDLASVVPDPWLWTRLIVVMRIGSLGRRSDGRRPSRIGGAIAIGAALLLATVSSSRADSAGEYTFTVLSEGNPVGRHRIAFEYAGDRVEIKEATEIEVSFATIPLYTFEHQALQLWQNGRAARIDATTNDNGEQLDITVRDTGDGYVRTVNGRVDRFDGSATVLALWNKETFDHDAYFSAVEDKVMDVSFEHVGPEAIVLAGRPVQTQRYRMVGDEEHDSGSTAAGTSPRSPSAATVRPSNMSVIRSSRIGRDRAAP